MASELLESEKIKIDLSSLPEEINLRTVDLGLSGLTKFVKNDNSNKKLLPTCTLPIGLPPVFSELKDDIEELLITPQDLPIHDFQSSQRYWEREKNIEGIYEASILPCPTELNMERDLKTGKIDNIHEIYNPEVGLSAHNSMSLKRKPGAFTDSVKGESMNNPFWPGGMDLPSLDNLVQGEKKNVDVDKLDLTKFGKVRPPGFDFDVTFEEKNTDSVDEKTMVTSYNEWDDLLDDCADPSSKVEEEPKMSATVNIADLLLADIDMSHLYVDVSEREATESEDKESPVDISYSVKEEIPDNVLEIKTDDADAAKESTVKVKKWSFLDDYTDVKDFHRMIPDMAFKYPFELDTFQKRAVLHLEKHENVLVAAHTSAGKTVVAEYAIALSIRHMRRAIYTSPIKALSNQKFRDFRGTFPEVGLLTGDVQIKPESPCLIMTTEILRSMLYNGSDVIRDVEWVIFDEIHYINDADRGVVWEEVLIMLPAHIGIILLSATVPNTLEFASWIGKTKQKEVYVVQTTKRPVPLEHYLFTGNSNKTSEELFCILDRRGKFLSEGYRAALNAKKERASKSDESYGAKGTRQGNPKQDRNVWNSVVYMLKKKDRLPCVAFTLSKRKCDINADIVCNTKIELVSSTEQSHITTFFNRSISKLKGTDQSLPQVLMMGELLKNGVGVHHSGILPILKEVVEMLFQKGLVKILFATETFAMGVNMPARTVVFDSNRKFDGVNNRELLSSEYIQMAGRAGRRGLDATGMVITLCKGDVPELSDLHKMMLGTATKLTSQFRLTYFMILNLLRVKQLTVQDMMKRSFAEYYLQRDSPENVKKLEELRIQVKTLKDPDCHVCARDLKDYYMAWAEVYQLKKEVKGTVLSSMNGQKSLTPGRVILISNNNHSNALGVILQHGGLESFAKFSSSDSKDPLTKIYTVLVLCNKSYEDKRIAEGGKKSKDDSSSSELIGNTNKLFQPEGQCGQIVEEIIAADISELINKTIKIDAEKIIDNHKKRIIPRFRFDPPSQSTILAGQDLLNLTYDYASSGVPSIHPIKNLNITSMDFVQKYQTMTNLEGTLTEFSCLDCSSFSEHFCVMRANMRVRKDVSLMELRLSDDSLELLEEYNQRIEVLKRLNYIDNDKNLRHKGRVAFEISTHEVMITELLINNVLTDLDPQEVVAILSCFVFEMKNVSKPTLTENLKKTVATVKEMAERVAVCQKECGLDVTIEDFVGSFHFGLVEVVYEWARGMPFKEVMTLTDTTEGNIVRCIQRLDEVCRDVRKAAHVIGVQTLCDKMERGMSLIRRDIVFAASLYTS